MTRRWRAWLLALALAAPGCMTFKQASDGRGPAMLGGIRLWTATIRSDHLEIPVTLRVIMFLFALPFDLAADAVFLPFATLNEAARGPIPVEGERGH